MVMSRKANTSKSRIDPNLIPDKVDLVGKKSAGVFRKRYRKKLAKIVDSRGCSISEANIESSKSKVVLFSATSALSPASTAFNNVLSDKLDIILKSGPVTKIESLVGIEKEFKPLDFSDKTSVLKNASRKFPNNTFVRNITRKYWRNPNLLTSNQLKALISILDGLDHAHL